MYDWSMYKTGHKHFNQTWVWLFELKVRIRHFLQGSKYSKATHNHFFIEMGFFCFFTNLCGLEIKASNIFIFYCQLGQVLLFLVYIRKGFIFPSWMVSFTIDFQKCNSTQLTKNSQKRILYIWNKQVKIISAMCHHFQLDK